MAINDPSRLVDGFRFMPDGMDGSKDPVLTPETSVYYSDNVVFRGGAGPKTRPGFSFINVPGYLGGSLFSGSNLQCSTVYNPPGREPVIVVVIDGEIYVIDIKNEQVIKTSSNAAGNILEKFNTSATCYACQVSDYLVIQDGVPYNTNWTNGPKILSWPSGSPTPIVELSSSYCDSDSRFRMPVGTHMAFGQGRLFIATSDREVVAGDLMFGGSTSSFEIKSSVPSTYTNAPNTPGLVIIETIKKHPFVKGDYVTISGHDNGEFAPSGTYVVLDRIKVVTNSGVTSYATATPAEDAYRFSINYVTDTGDAILPGSGGQASLFTAGTSKDSLRFSETTFINEGGALLIPGEIGTIMCLAFVPLQDVSTGQGDLIVFGSSGASSFSVSTPRQNWKEAEGFQRLLFSDIGSLSNSTISINGDIYFRSLQGNGIRTYRNARAEFGGFGMTPTSSEMDSVFLNEDTTKLSKVSLIHFDDRLLITCRPKEENGKITFRGIIALDFRPVSSNSVKTHAVYDGVWSGLKIVSLLKTEFSGAERAYAICYHNNIYELWEITKNQTYDKKVTEKRITSLILTKAFDFESPWSEKKLLHGDLWFSNIKNSFNASLWFRPDNNPNWQAWGSWELCYNNLPGYSSRLRSSPPSYENNEFTKKAMGRGYDFKIRILWEGNAQLEKALFHSHKLIEAVGVSFDSPSATCISVSDDTLVDTLEDTYISY